jgi:hypothetical protein
MTEDKPQAISDAVHYPIPSPGVGDLIGEAETVAIELLALHTDTDNHGGDHYDAECEICNSPEKASYLLTRLVTALRSQGTGEREKRLEEALRDVLDWIDNWSPSFTQDDEWPASKARVLSALSLEGLRSGVPVALEPAAAPQEARRASPPPSEGVGEHEGLVEEARAMVRAWKTPNHTITGHDASYMISRLLAALLRSLVAETEAEGDGVAKLHGYLK